MKLPKFVPLAAYLGALSLVACGDDSSAEDAGQTPDATVRPDAAVSDTGIHPDAGPSDTGVHPDATTTEDAGGPDAAESDAGEPPTLGPVSIVISPTGHDRLLGAAHDSTGRLYVTGYVADSTIAPDHEVVVGRLLPDGSPDPSFGTNGFTRVNVIAAGAGELARGIVVQSDGKIVVSAIVEDPDAADARDRDVALVRFDEDGTLDGAFGTDGVTLLDLSVGEVSGSSFVADFTWGLSRYANDDLLIIGSLRAPGRTDSDFFAARVTADGELDENFGTDGVFTLDIDNNDASPRTASILEDGSAVVAGYMSADGIVVPVLYKLTSEGELDTSFGVGGVYTEVVLGAVAEAYAAAIQGTSFVTAGYGRDSASDDLDWISLRINANGTRDENFGVNGVASFDFAGNNDNARTLVVLPDDRIMLVGGGRPTTENSDGLVVVLTADGAVDTSFGQAGRMSFDFGGPSDFFWGASLAPDGSHVLVAGTKQVAADDGENDDGVVLIVPLE